MKQQIKNIVSGKFLIIPMLVAVPLLSSCTGHSGIVSANNFESGKSLFMTQWDINGDGQVTCIDAAHKQEQKFNKADLNNNGSLDIEEFKQAPWSNTAFAEEHITLFDQDRNGKVSSKEFSERPNTEFAAIDRNQNCIISDREIAIMLDQRRGYRKRF